MTSAGRFHERSQPVIGFGNLTAAEAVMQNQDAGASAIIEYKNSKELGGKQHACFTVAPLLFHVKSIDCFIEGAVMCRFDAILQLYILLKRLS
jgi:hypothetical protein